MPDEFIQRFLDASDTREVLAWLRGGDGQFRSLGELETNEESIELAEELYAAGAVKVLAVEIADEGEEGQNSGKLIIELPNDDDDRERLFEIHGQMAREQGFDPEPDAGQSHLFVMLD